MFKQVLLMLSIILSAGMAFTMGLIGSRIVSFAVGFSAPRMPAQAPESIAGFYLLAGSIILAGGLALLAKDMRGSLPVRWLMLAIFLALGFAVSSTVEASLFSSATGTLRMVPMLLLPCVLQTGVLALVALLPSSAQDQDRQGRGMQFSHERSLMEWAWRAAAAIASYPLIYFLFGFVLFPVVSVYYAGGDHGLALPTPKLIVQAQLLRSVMHLACAIPVILLWRASRRHLVIALALAFFVCMFAYDIVLANQLPTAVVVVRGGGVLAGSLVYAWSLVNLLMPGRQ
jgi:hypothetical protein